MKGWLLSFKSLDIKAHIAFNDKQHHMGSVSKASGQYARKRHLEPISNAQLASKLAMGWTGTWPNGTPYTVPARDILGQFADSDEYKALRDEIEQQVVNAVHEYVDIGKRKQYTVGKTSPAALRQDVQDIVQEVLESKGIAALRHFLERGGLMPENSEWWAYEKGWLPPGIHTGKLVYEGLEFDVDKAEW